MNTKELLISLNTELFGVRQPSTEHEIYLVGRKDTVGAEGAKKTIALYLLKSKPNTKAKAAGIKVQNFLHAAMKPVGMINTDESGKRSFAGPKKARTSIIFQNTQPDLYNFIKEGIFKESKDETTGKVTYVLSDESEGAYTKAGYDAQNRPMLKIRDTVFGKKISFNTENYNPHSMTEEGNLEGLKATTFNPKTGKYEKKLVTIGVYEFFADDDDLDKLLETCARHYAKHVAPFVTEKKTIVTEKGNTITKEVVEPEITGPDEPMYDDEGNQVDDEGKVLKTKEELDAEAAEE
jgi:hypothetical protein